MKTTYLLNKKQPDGSICLSLSTAEEWRIAVAANKKLPAEQRRYFIFDYIPERDTVDRMVIETSLDDYRKWHREHMSAERNREEGKKYQILSLDAIVMTGESPSILEDFILSEEQEEDSVCDQALMRNLRTKLSGWRPWANDMLDLYLQGKMRTCTPLLAKKYGVSLQTVRKYKRQFETFVKSFLSGVSF